MAFPTIPTGARVLNNVQNNTTATRTFPALSGLTKNAGDLLIAVVVGYQSSAASGYFSGWSDGFTEFGDFGSSSTMCIGAAYKWSTGSETAAPTVTQVATITGFASMFLLSIPGAHASTPPEAGSYASGTGAANPASFDPAGWAAEDTLWISVAGNGETATTGTWTGLATAPTNFASTVLGTQGTDAVGGTHAAVAFRQQNASAQDVAAWTGDTSNARDAAIVIAVRPAPTTISGSFTANAVLLKNQSSSLTANAVLLKNQSSSLTANAVLQRTGTSGSLTADADIKRTGIAGSFTADAVLKKTLSSSFTADAVFPTTVSGSFTADAVLKKTLSGSFSADAVLKRVISSSVSANAVLKRNIATPLTIILRDDFNRTVSAGGLETADVGGAYSVVSGTAANFSVAGGQAAILVPAAGSITQAARVPDSAVTGRIWVRATFIFSSLSSALSRLEIIGRWVSAGTGDRIGISIASGGAEPVSGFQRHNGTTNILGEFGTYVAGETWNLVGIIDQGVGFAVKTWKVGAVEPDFAVDSGLMPTVGVATGGIAAVTVGSDATLAVLDLAVWTGQGFTANSILKATISSSLTADAVLKKTISSSFTADAVLKKTLSFSFTADAILLKTQPASFTTNAVLLKTASASFTANAVLKKSQSGSLTADASLFGVVSGSFTASAILRTLGRVTYLLDTFQRTDGSGLGFSDDGQEWTTESGTPTVDGSVALIPPSSSASIGGAGGPVRFLIKGRVPTDESGSEVDIIRVTRGSFPQDGIQLQREQSGGDQYLHVIALNGTAGGGGQLYLLGSSTDWWWTRAEVEGTTTRIRSWVDGDVEPTVWESVTGTSTGGSQPFRVSHATANGATGVFELDFISIGDEGQNDGRLSSDAVLREQPGFSADALIVRNVLHDTFTRVVASGLGTADDGTAYQQRPGGLGTASVDGSQGVASAASLLSFIGYEAPRQGLIQFDFYVPGSDQSVGYSIDFADGDTSSTAYVVSFGGGNWAAGAGDTASTGTFVPDLATWYVLKAWMDATTGRVKIWKRGDPEPDWASSDANTFQPASVTPALTLNGSLDPVQIDNLDIWDASDQDSVFHELSLDAVLLKTQTGSFSVDAVLFKTQASSLSADAVLLRTQTGSLSGDAWLLQIRVGSLSADAIRLRTIVSVFQPGAFQPGAFQVLGLSADAVLLISRTGSLTADAVVLRTAIAGVSSDGVLFKTITGSFTANAVLMPTLAADAVILRTISGSFTANAVLMPTLAADAVLLVTRTGSFTGNAWIQGSGISAITADAVLFQTISLSFQANAVLLATRSVTFTANAVLLRLRAASFTGDAVQQKIATGSLSAQAVTLAVRTVGLTQDAILLSPRGATLSGNAVLRSTISGSLTANAVLRASSSSALVADALLRRSTSSSFTADAVLVLGAQTHSLTAQAVLLRVRSASFNTNAILRVSVSASFTANALARRSSTVQITGDAWKRRVQTSTLSGAAVLQAARSSAFTSDAYLLTSSSALILADALLVAGRQGSVSGDAVLFGSTTRSLSANAILTITRTGRLAADLSARTLAADLTTGTLAATLSAGSLAGLLTVRALGADPSARTLAATLILLQAAHFSADAVLMPRFTANAVLS